MYIWVWETPGAQDFGMGVYEQGEGNGKISLPATWERGGRILSQQGGFQVSKGRQMGSKREWRRRGSKKQGDFL
jgi:hypothetical protein